MFPKNVVLKSSSESVLTNKNHILHVKEYDVLTFSVAKKRIQENNQNSYSYSRKFISRDYPPSKHLPVQNYQ